MHRRGGAGVVFRLLQVDGEHLVADPVQRIEASVAFEDALGGDTLLQILDLLVLLQHQVDLVFQRLAVIQRGVRSEDTIGEAAEPAGPYARQQQRDPHALFHRKQVGERRTAVDDDGGVLVGEASGVTGGAGQADAGHVLLVARVAPRRARRVEHRGALREADRQRLLAGDDGVRDEAVAIEIGGVAEQAHFGEQQRRNRRLLQRHEPFIGEAEGPRALIGMIEPAQLFLADVLVEPDGLLRRGIFRDPDMEIFPGLGDVVLEGVANADDQYADNNFNDRLATHGLPLPKTALVARKIRLSSKTPGKRLIFGVRTSIIPACSGVKGLSTNPGDSRRSRVLCRLRHFTACRESHANSFTVLTGNMPRKSDAPSKRTSRPRTVSAGCFQYSVTAMAGDIDQIT